MPLSDELISKFVVDFCVADPQQRRATAAKWLDYYEGRQLKHVPKNPDESPEHFDKRPKITFNLTRRILDFKACLYDDGAERECSDPVVRDFWAQVDLDTRLREADPIIELCGTYFVAPDFVVEEHGYLKRLAAWIFRRPAPGLWSLQVFAPNQVAVLVDADVPDMPAALALISKVVDAKGTEKVRSQIWTDSFYYEFLGTEQAKREEHSFGRIPVAVLRNKASHVQDFWGVGAGENIVPQNEEINRELSSSEWLVICQSHGQWVFTNAPADFKPKLGTDQVIKIYSDPSNPEMPVKAELVAPNSDVDKLRAHVDWLIDGLQASNDVPAGTFQLGQNREAGVAIDAKLREAKRYRKRRKPQARAWERELANLARVVHAVRTGQKPPADPVDVKVNWREPEAAASVSETVQMEQHELQVGLATGPQLLQRRDPDLGDAEAEKRFDANQAFNQAHGARAVESALPGEGEPVTDDARAAAKAALAAAEGAAGE